MVSLSVTDGLTEFWTATDFLAADYSLKICEQQIYFHRYRTTDYLYFFFSNLVLLLLLVVVVIVVVAVAVFSNLILFRNMRTEIRIQLRLKKSAYRERQQINVFLLLTTIQHYDKRPQ